MILWCLLRSPPEPEENLYLQCESADDAIYGNDPACSLSIMTPDEDVYVVPDAWLGSSPFITAHLLFHSLSAVNTLFSHFIFS